MLALTICTEAGAQAPTDDPSMLCERAARQAEHDWNLPPGLLAAIGLVESGRRAPAGAHPIIWPWTINAEGQGYYQPSKAAAVGMVRALQQRGARLIDVGCFQVDLFYHPYVFANLEQGFDPQVNAHAAARILSLGRFRNTGWDGAITAYHSAVPILGARYLQKVHAVWPWVAAHRSWGEPETQAYAVLLSPQAHLVRVVTPFDVSTEGLAASPQIARGIVRWPSSIPMDLPRVLSSSSRE